MEIKSELPGTMPPKIGLWRATSLVAGNMIASGIFMLPVALAGYGSISILGWIVSGVGAWVLALVFSKLSMMLPGAEGGPYAYTREGLGEFAGFLVAWGYWISIWATNAAISLAFVSYLSVFIPALNESGPLSLLVANGAVWFLTWVNTRGIRVAGGVQLITTIMKLIPLFALALAGLFYLDFSHFTVWNSSQVSFGSALTSTATLTLFAFLGLECATIPAGSIEHPERTVPRATLFGTGIVGAVYILSTVSLMGLLTPEELGQSTSPFADGAARIGGEWARYVVAAGALISTFGALNGWILIQGQMPMAAAADRLFPAVFSRRNRFGAPAGGIVLSSTLISALLAMKFTSSLAEMFESVILFATAAVLVAYLLSTASLMVLTSKIKEKGAERKYVVLGLIGFFYSIWAFAGAGSEAVFWGMLTLFAGVPLYAFRRRAQA